MTTANRVQETSTTTGTGNIALAGADGNNKTFTSRYALNEPFNYLIDDESGNWEAGLGHLSATTTLVRQKPLDGSAATPINFSAGTKKVFIADLAENAGKGIPSVDETISLTSRILPVNWTHSGTGTQVTTANQIMYTPVYIDHAISLVDMSVEITATGGTKARLGLYSWRDGLPSVLLVGSADIDTTTTGLKAPSMVFDLKAGWYFTAFLSDSGVTARRYGSNATALLGSPAGIRTAQQQPATNFLETIGGGWSNLPSSATPTSLGNNKAYIIGFGK